MKDWQRILIGPTVPLRDALEAIDKAGSRIVLVVDEARHLLGSLSDGDVRRALLRGLTLADPVASAMHVGPTTAGARSAATRTATSASCVAMSPHRSRPACGSTGAGA